MFEIEIKELVTEFLRLFTNLIVNKPYGENVTSSKHAASMQQASCRQAASSNSLLAMAYFK